MWRFASLFVCLFNAVLRREDKPKLQSRPGNAFAKNILVEKKEIEFLDLNYVPSLTL